MLKIYLQVYNQMIRHCRSEGNREATGFITEAEAKHEQMQIPMKNVHRNPTRYFTWEAEETVRAYEAMDRRGHKPLAIYHSHPGGKPDPSETDMQAANQQGFHYVIAHPITTHLWVATAWWCMEPGILVSEGLEVI